MPAFSQRTPDDLHAALRAFLNTRPWLSQNDLVNGAIASMIGFPDYRVDTAPPTLQDYLRAGSVDEATFEALRRAVQTGKVIGVFGPRGSGKTSLLKALLNEYQHITSSARRAMVVTIVPADFKKLTPLVTVALTDPVLQSEGIVSVPDFVDSIFSDDVLPHQMSPAIEAWSNGLGGAFTICANRILLDSPTLDSATAITVFMRDGNVVECFDRNEPSSDVSAIDTTTSSAVKATHVFAQLFSHFSAAGRITRVGPNSGRSPSSMTRRIMIKHGHGQVGTLEIATVMKNAFETDRRLTWTSNIALRDDISRDSSAVEIHDFEHGVAVIGDLS